MTSWKSLPFEVKAQILAHYIEIALRSGRQDYFHYKKHGPMEYHQYELQRAEQFTEDILSVLEVAPEMQPETATIVDSSIKQRSSQKIRLDREAEGIPGPEQWFDKTVSENQRWAYVRRRDAQDEIDLLEDLVCYLKMLEVVEH